MNVNAFVRQSVIDVIVHGDKVIIGQVEPVAGDIRVVANVPKALLYVNRFDGVKWHRIGGHWDGRFFRMSSEMASLVHAVAQALVVHDWIMTAACMLKIDSLGNMAGAPKARAAKARKAPQRPMAEA